METWFPGSLKKEEVMKKEGKTTAINRNLVRIASELKGFNNDKIIEVLVNSNDPTFNPFDKLHFAADNWQSATQLIMAHIICQPQLSKSKVENLLESAHGPTSVNDFLTTVALITGIMDSLHFALTSHYYQTEGERLKKKYCFDSPTAKFIYQQLWKSIVRFIHEDAQFHQKFNTHATLSIEIGKKTRSVINEYITRFSFPKYNDPLWQFLIETRESENNDHLDMITTNIFYGLGAAASLKEKRIAALSFRPYP